MTELKLRRTWHQISESLKSSSPNPLRIVELINRVRPCSWTFLFTFDGGGRTTLEIFCESPVSDTTARGILDGIVEELFYADTISVRLSEEYKSGDISSLLECPPDSNVLNLGGEESNVRKNDPLYVLEGFWQSNTLPSEIQNSQAVQDYLLEHTWLGSPKYIGTAHCVRWRVFGTQQVIHPGSRYANRLGKADNYCTEVDLYCERGGHIGQAIFQTSPTLRREEFYTTFGPASSSSVDLASLEARNGPSWLIEMGSPAFANAVQNRESTGGLISQLKSAAEQARLSVLNLTCFQTYVKRTLWKQQASSASLLKLRQERAKTGDCVKYQDQTVMLEPSNENEVLVLLCKLEGLQALPFSEFCLWEYTSREGIDALATYQVKEVDVAKQLSAIEVEYYFENFLDHNHPHQQVDLVVCWDFRAVDFPSNLHQRCEWLFEYRNDDIFQVVVLSRIPDVRVERM